MDSDSRALLKVVFGLGCIVLLILIGVGTLDYIEDLERAQNLRARQITAVSAETTKLPLNAHAPSPDNAPLTTPPRTYSAYEGKCSTFEPEKAHETGEVILADPPDGFEDRIRPDGYRVMEYTNLGSLGMTIVRVATPPNQSLSDAIQRLSILLPGIEIGANNHFEASTGIDRSGTNPREMAGWENLSPTCGAGLVLGQIDSGVDFTHPALRGQDLEYRAFTKPGRTPGPAGHGTSVAAMLVGKPEWGGLLPGAKLYAANMFELNEQGKKVGSAFGLLKAVDWMASLKVDAVNLSIAGGDNKVVRKAFELAQKAGLMLVASVGNWGRSDISAYPAAYPYVIAVTATNGTELIYSFANQGDYVDFAAPGVGIYTALPGGGGKPQSGTSFAAPYITAMAAILTKAGKTPDAAALRTLLSRATRDLGKPGKDSIFGYGYVKARPACR